MNNEYKKIIKNILENGINQKCRNGTNIIIPHYSFTINNIKDNHKISLRKMYYKGVEGEFNTLIDPTPLTNIKQFEDNGCNYWKLWSDEGGSINIDYHNMLHPQLEDIIQQIKDKPNSRRHHIELWNPENVKNNVLSLPCCWNGLTFSVINNTLHLKWSQRSVDVMLGLPADVYLAYLFMQHIASLCNLKIGSCMFSLSNLHIYDQHIKNAKILLNNTVSDCDKKIEFELIA